MASTKEQQYGLVEPPAQQCDEQHPEQQNCIPRSIACPSATEFGGDDAVKNCHKLEQMKNMMVRVPSTEKDTRGRRTILNHL